MCDLRKHETSFAHVALEIAFSKVFFQGCVDLMLVFSDGGTKTFQGTDTKIKILSCAGVEVLALFIQKLGDLFFFHGLKLLFENVV